MIDWNNKILKVVGGRLEYVCVSCSFILLVGEKFNNFEGDCDELFLKIYI